MASIYDELEAGLLTAAPITYPTVSCRLVMAVPTESPPSVLMTHFAETLRTEVHRMVNEGIWVGELSAD